MTDFALPHLQYSSISVCAVERQQLRRVSWWARLISNLFYDSKISHLKPIRSRSETIKTLYMLRHFMRTQTPSRHAALQSAARSNYCSYRWLRWQVLYTVQGASEQRGQHVCLGLVFSRTICNKWDNFLGIRESCENCCGEYIQM